MDLKKILHIQTAIQVLQMLVIASLVFLLLTLLLA